MWLNNHPLLTYIDLHGHGSEKHCFIYGGQFLNYDDRYYKTRLLPAILANQTEMFSFDKCWFDVDRKNRIAKVSRGAIAILCDLASSYTLESSVYAYKSNKKIVMFTPQSYQLMVQFFNLRFLMVLGKTYWRSAREVCQNS
jgi:hypothetical protein